VLIELGFFSVRMELHDRITKILTLPLHDGKATVGAGHDKCRRYHKHCDSQNVFHDKKYESRISILLRAHESYCDIYQKLRQFDSKTDIIRKNLQKVLKIRFGMSIVK
jgi:hypothetical protein